MEPPLPKVSSHHLQQKDEYNSQFSEMMTQPEPMTQNELTQLAVDEDSNLFSPLPPHAAIHPKQQPWGRLVPCSGDKRSGGLDLLPREPPDEKRIGGIHFMGLERLRPVDIFNLHTLGRSSKCDVQAKPPPKNIDNKKLLALHDWVHAMISNTHCKIYCMLKSPGPSLEMEVYIEDTSGNGTLINGSTLLRRGEKRLLHTGDEISLVNPQTLQKKISATDILQSLHRKHAFIFVNLFQQQQGHQSTLMSCLRQKRPMMPPPLSASARKKGLVDPKAMVNHSLDRYAHPQPFFMHQGNARSRISPTKTTPPRRVEQFYDIRDILGAGTVGEVRRAIHRRTGEERAVKVISLVGRNRGVRLTDEASATLEAEASILQALDHPYIVKLHDVFVAPGVAIYLVMELLHGGDLFDRIVEKGKYTELESRKVMRRLLSAVYYLHEEQNVVHRDLKPENILVVNRQSDIDIKLTDFGLAKSMTEDGLKTFCGTPQYFAPEVLRRQNTVAGQGRYGKQADMWSIGVILYILLSGAPPFDVSQGFDEVAEAKIKFPHNRWHGISKEAEDLVKKLLLADPTKRISVSDACVHEWILMSDGDTHTHPLDDPVIRSLNDDESSNQSIKIILFDNEKSRSSFKEVDNNISKDSSDDGFTCLSTRTGDDMQVKESQKVSPVRWNKGLVEQEKSHKEEPTLENKPCDNFVVNDQATPEGEKRTPLGPIDLNQRSNHFREIIAKTSEKEATTPKNKKTDKGKVVRLHDPNNSGDEQDSNEQLSKNEVRSRAVTPLIKGGKARHTKVYGKRSRAEENRYMLELKAAELSEDEIFSQFTDEIESISTFGTSTVTARGNVDNTGGFTVERSSSSSSYSLSDREGTSRKVEVTGVPVPRPTKRAKTVTPEGDKGELNSSLPESRDEQMAGSRKQQASGKQTKLSSWFFKKTIS